MIEFPYSISLFLAPYPVVAYYVGTAAELTL